MGHAGAITARVEPDHSVEIEVDRDGNFIYKGKGVVGSQVHVGRGESIRWASNRSFAVHFQAISPFDKVDFPGLKLNNRETGFVTETGVVTISAPSGTYKYIVAAMDEGKRIHIDDPHVIVP